ncbi:hypothetical protein ACK3YM_08460 [Aeromonas caviae]
MICNPDMEISGGITVDESLLLPLQPSNKNEKSRATYDRNIFVIGKVLQVYISGASLEGSHEFMSVVTVRLEIMFLMGVLISPVRTYDFNQSGVNRQVLVGGWWPPVIYSLSRRLFTGGAGRCCIADALAHGYSWRLRASNKS